MMYQRQLVQTILDRLSLIPAVVILGPRQIGKTTLAKVIASRIENGKLSIACDGSLSMQDGGGQAVDGGCKILYLDLENPEDLQKLNDTAHYLGLHADKLVILDEIQRYPDLFMRLRGIIDDRRREGRPNGHFLLLGSASNELLKQSAESLAGRVHYCELTALNPFEIEKPNGKPLQQLWLRGGFPDSYAALNDRASHVWRLDFIRTYLERDIPQLGPRIPATTLMRFWSMLAHSQGELLNASKLADSLGVKSVTISRYLDLMVDLFLVRKLEPWYGNIKKRLVKSPRIYVRDSGILHAMLKIPDYEALLGHPVLGKSWEGFVIETIINALPSDVHSFFYRTSAGAEIDLVIEFGINDYWAVEIKASRAPKLTKGFHMACEDLQVKQKFVVYPGVDKFLLSQDTTVLSLAHFIQVLRQRFGL